MREDLANVLGVKRQHPYMIEFKQISNYTDRWKINGKITSPDKIEGTFSVLDIISKHWAPGDEGIFLYELGVNILSKLDNITDEQLLRDIKDARQRMINYEKIHNNKDKR